MMNHKMTIAGLSLVLGFAYIPFAGAAKNEAETPLGKVEKRVTTLENEVEKIEDLGGFKDKSLEQSNMSSDEIQKLATDNLLKIYSYNFLNYEQVLKNIRSLFTQDGYDSYMKALDESKNLDIIKSDKLKVSSVLGGETSVLKEGVVGGIYTWEVQVPLLVSYKSPTKKTEQQMNVVVEMVREHLDKAPKGVLIHAITATIGEAQKAAAPAPEKAEKTEEKAEKPGKAEKTEEKSEKSVKPEKTEKQETKLPPAPSSAPSQPAANK
ncbi:MAG: DotI/IcmL family type IV secretion protein [Candidatus Berkiellales bacterium]